MPQQTHGTEPPRAVGLLCGSGLLPVRVAQALAADGVRVVAIGIKGEADPEIAGFADEVHWTGVAKLGAWIRLLKGSKVDAVLMCGGIRKRRMFDGQGSLLPDWRSFQLFYRELRTREDHTILEAVAAEFEKEGLPVGSVPEYCPGLMAPRGCITRRHPAADQWGDIRFAWPIAKQVAALQIGQCIVVRDRTVVAVEGIDGTDAVLERGGALAGGGAVAVKVAKDGHDVRFDVPCIGPDTVDTLGRAAVAVLAIEAGRTIVLDRDVVEAKADEARVCIVGVSAEDVGDGA